MKFCWCTISVSNLEQSIRFYQQIVGLSLNRRFVAGPGVEIAFLGTGGTEIELICDSNRQAPVHKEGISLGFSVSSLDKQIEFIKEKGLEVEGGPLQPNPNVRFFFVKDPNGVSIQFVEHIM